VTAPPIPILEQEISGQAPPPAKAEIGVRLPKCAATSVWTCIPIERLPPWNRSGTPCLFGCLPIFAEDSSARQRPSEIRCRTCKLH